LAEYGDMVAKIRFFSKIRKVIEGKEEIVKILDDTLKKGGDFDVYGDLSPGVESLVNYFQVIITERKKDYFIDCGPLSGYGHDVQFSINKKSKKIDKKSICVGEIISPPSDDED